MVALFQAGHEGSDPLSIRSALASRFSSGQVIKRPELAHITLARLVARKEDGSGIQTLPAKDAARLTRRLTSELCGLEVSLEEAWLVYERDFLALGFGGNYSVRHKWPMECPKRDSEVE